MDTRHTLTYGEAERVRAIVRVFLAQHGRTRTTSLHRVATYYAGRAVLAHDGRVSVSVTELTDARIPIAAKPRRERVEMTDWVPGELRVELAPRTARAAIATLEGIGFLVAPDDDTTVRVVSPIAERLTSRQRVLGM